LYNQGSRYVQVTGSLTVK